MLMVVFFCIAFAFAHAEQDSKILILAQGRSGSTFLSSWFGSLPNVNYYIEPCSMVYAYNVRKDRTGLDCATFIKELFACDFSRANVERDQSKFIPEKARKAFKGWGHQGDTTDVSECKQRRAHVTKELRMGMVWANHTVEFDRVIVLFRDPRAIMNSRQADWPKPMRSYTKQDDHINPHGWNGQTGFPYTQSIRSLCIEHLALRKRIAEETLSSKRVMVIEYSDVLKNSLALSRQAMEFTGLQEFFTTVEAHVKRNSNGDCIDPDTPFSVCRSKVPTTDDKWKKTLSLDTLEEINQVDECVEVITTYYTHKDEL